MILDVLPNRISPPAIPGQELQFEIMQNRYRMIIRYMIDPGCIALKDQPACHTWPGTWWRSLCCPRSPSPPSGCCPSCTATIRAYRSPSISVAKKFSRSYQSNSIRRHHLLNETLIFIIVYFNVTMAFEPF